jgi:hypothetical protein
MTERAEQLVRDAMVPDPLALDVTASAQEAGATRCAPCSFATTAGSSA